MQCRVFGTRNYNKTCLYDDLIYNKGADRLKIYPIFNICILAQILIEQKCANKKITDRLAQIQSTINILGLRLDEK